MKRNVSRPVVLVVVMLFLCGCACLWPLKHDDSQMYELGAKLILLSAAVEDKVYYGGASSGMSDEELLALSTQHDPSLLEPFKAYLVKVLRENRHAVVLVCSKDGMKGLLEDAACSRPMDKHLWKLEPPAPCQFTLSVTAVCQ